MTTKTQLTCIRLLLFCIIIFCGPNCVIPAADVTGPRSVVQNLSGHSAFQEATDEHLSQDMKEHVTVKLAAEETAILELYEELFNITYEKSPDIRIARARKHQKSKQRYTTWAKRFIPAVDLEASQVHEIDQGHDSNSSTSYQDGDDYTDWAINMDFPIYRREVSLQVEIVGLDEQLADNQLMLKTQELNIRLRELFGNYLVSSYRLLNMNNSLRISHEHMEKIQRGYDLRDQTRLQLLRAQANLKSLEATRDLDEQRRDTSFRELLDYTDMHREHPIFTKINSLLISEVQAAGCIDSFADIESSYGLIKEFVEKYPDEELRRYFLDHSLLNRKITLERDLAYSKAKTLTQKEWPSLSVQGKSNRQEDTRFSDFNGEGSVALVLTVPIFSGGTLKSTREEKRMAQHIADVTKYSDLNRTVHAIENNRNMIINFQKVFAARQVHLNQQQEIVTLSLKSYRIKQISMQDLLTSKNSLIDAKNALMETTNKLGFLFRKFAWQLGCPYTPPSVTNNR